MMDASELRELRTEFMNLDADSSGYVDRGEARKHILLYVKRRQKAKNASWSDDQVNAMVDEKTKRYMAKYDLDKDGFIVFADYVELAHDLEVQIYRRAMGNEPS